MKKRNRTIEFMRLMFAIMVMGLHSNSFLKNTGIVVFKYGAIAVEFFFLLNGYLMMKEIDNVDVQNSGGVLGKETFLYVWKKYASLFPYLLFSHCMAIILRYLLGIWKLSDGVSSILQTIPELLLIHQSGIAYVYINNPMWYLSSMLIAMAVYYPLARKNKDMFMYVIAPLAALLIHGWAYQTDNTFYGTWHEWLGISFSGNLRAFGMIPLGCTCYVFTKWFANISWRKWNRALLTLIEIVCYFGVFWTAWFGNSRTEMTALIPVLFIGIALSFSDLTYSGVLIPDRICKWFGKLSVALYFNHYYVVLLISKKYMYLDAKERLLLYFGCCLLCTSLCMLICNYAKKVWLKIKRLWIVEEANLINED